MYIKSKRIFST